MYENNYTYSPDSQNNEHKGPENAAQVTEKKKKGMPKVAKALQQFPPVPLPDTNILMKTAFRLLAANQL